MTATSVYRRAKLSICRIVESAVELAMDHKILLFGFGGIATICAIVFLLFSGRETEEILLPAPAPSPSLEMEPDTLGTSTAEHRLQVPELLLNGDATNDGSTGKSVSGVEVVEVVSSKRVMPEVDLPKDREVLTDSAPEIDRASCDAIEYPKQSLMDEETGTTVVGVLVSAYGTPLDVVIEKSSGYKRLDSASKKNVMTCRFNAALRGSVSYQTWVKTEYVWQLD